MKTKILLRLANRWIFLLAIGFFSGSVAFAQPGKKEKKGGVKQVKEHIFFEEFEEAIPQLEALLESDPQNAYYNYWMGKCLYVTYKKNKALKYFQVVEKTNPSVDKEFHWYYALTLHYNLMFDAAIAEYKLDLERFTPESDQYREVANRISQCAFAKKMKMKKEGNLVKITNLGESINTEYSEHSPVISANDSILIYTARRPESLGAKPQSHFYDEDLYVSYNLGNNWTQAQNIQQPVNSKGHDATISLTADGKTLYIYRQKKSGGLYVTDFDTLGKKWREPRAIEKPLNSKYYETSICRSADEDILFFTSDRPGGYGGKDIYWVKKDGNDWGIPQNLGSKVNTVFDEDAPFFHPDGKTLYFSSNGPRSIGGYDIFVTEWDSNGGDWLESLNMGYPVNTGDDDIYFVINNTGLTGYYSSGKEGGFGEKDIYRIDFPYYRYPKRYYAVEVVGVVQDVETLDTLNALVKLVDNLTGRVVDSIQTHPETKQYLFELESGKTYTLQAFSEGYDMKTEQITSPAAIDDDVSLIKDVAVIKPKEIPVVTRKEIPEIQHIYYDFDKDFLRKESKVELDRVIALLKDEPFVTVEIMAHTDWFNTFDYNVNLSQRRAKSAYDYLIEMGADPSQVSIKWFSENTPLETNENDEGRQFNRRAEFRFFKNGQLFTSSVRLRKGNEFPVVDHTRPKGLPGFDKPEARVAEKSSSATSSNEGFASVQMPDTRLETPAIVSAEEIGGPEKSLSNRFTPASQETGAADPLAEILPASSGNGKSLRNIYFDYDKADLRSESVNTLRSVAALMKQNPDYRLEIRGHTDNHGANAYNDALSEKRCASAITFLLNSGVSESMIMATAMGENLPADNNDTESGRQNNRRVEFVLRKGNEIILLSQN